MANKKKTQKAAAAQTAARVWIYLGPSKRGLIQHAAIFAGTRENVLREIAAAVAAVPEIEELVVPADEVRATNAALVAKRGEKWQAFLAILKK